MKCKIPEISWHNRDPVLSVDLQPKLERQTDTKRVYRLASGGTDSHVLIWYLELNTETGDVDIELAADLSRHQRAVNAVKWSPNGELLASGDDESVIFIWKQKSETETLNLLENTNAEDKEIWLTMKILRGHMEDVYDLSWSPNSQLLVSGSVDNTAMIWDVYKGKSLAILNDHKGFVQGVAWDPFNKYIATLSTDRYLRIFDIQTRKVVHRINKSALPVGEDHDLFEKQCRLFHDDTLQTFFRRLTFTPDGKLLITPAGFVEYADFTHPMETSYIFSRYDLKQPAIVLPSPEQYTVAVRCCPILFKLRAHSEDFTPVVPLPYRMIFAVATRSSVYFYDTQQVQPFAVISNIHYTRLTDITWSADGRVVVVSSTDGFCSLINFNEGELGEEYAQKAADLLPKEQVLQNINKKKQNNKNKLQKAAPTKKPVDEEKENKIEFIIDKEVISTAEKFETPAKKALAATPIEVRRHPRPPAELSASEKVVENKVDLVVVDEASNEHESILEDDEELTTDEEDDDDYSFGIAKMKTNYNDYNDDDVISDDDDIISDGEDQKRMENKRNEKAAENFKGEKEAEKNEKETANSFEDKEKHQVEVINIDDTEEVEMEVDEKIENASENFKGKLVVDVEEAEKIVKETTNLQFENKEKEKESVEQKQQVINIDDTEKVEMEVDKKSDFPEDENKTEQNNTGKAVEVTRENIENPTEDKTQNLSEKIIIDSPVARPNYLSPSERTPRRVALRTISTPKSKKKLID